jgi:hypothetical protein
VTGGAGSVRGRSDRAADNLPAIPGRLHESAQGLDG